LTSLTKRPYGRRHGGAPGGAALVFAPAQEIRFAVVLYGGVSLAVYINGVARELFSLVRATAPEVPIRPRRAASARWKAAVDRIRHPFRRRGR
jgi:hypothetical protein